MKIGVSSYSYQQYINKGKLDRISIIKKAADMGFETIEYTGFDDFETQEERCALAEKIKAEAKKQGLEISAYVIGAKLLQETSEQVRAEVERIKRQLDVASVLGAPNFRFDVLAKLPLHRSFDSVLEEFVPSIREIADYGQSLGIKTMIENHGYAFQDCDRVEKTYNAVNHENFGLLIDIGNFLCADEDNVRCVSNLANLASHVHLKDMVKIDYYSEESKEGCFSTRCGNYLKGVAVGAGDAKTAQCLTILRNAGYDGYVNIEYEGHEDCIKGIEKGLAFYKNYMKDNK